MNDVTLRKFAGHLPTSPVNSRIHTSLIAHYVGLPSHSLLSWLESAKNIIWTIGYLVCIFVGLQQLFQFCNWKIGVLRHCLFPDVELGRCFARIIHTLWPNVAYFLLGLAPRWRGMPDDNLPPGVVRRRQARRRQRREREEAAAGFQGTDQTAASDDEERRRGGGGARPRAPPPTRARNTYKSIEPEMSRAEIREQLNQLEYLSKRLSALQSRDDARRNNQGGAHEDQPLILRS